MLIASALLISQTVSASQLPNNRDVSQTKQWQRLLHFRHNSPKSEILSEAFFLSDNGANDPHSELEATLQAFSAVMPGESGAHCQFPARYFWLKQRGYALPGSLNDCASLMAWAKTDQIQSISLMLVSGYFGNPASSFGHALLKINNHEYQTSFGLLDLGINFGAMVPPGELVPVYILKGLFGGYKAGFSDRSFYAQDQVYARTEQRDMWEYELNLTEEQQLLLVFHIWELAGKHFRYFFLKQNCAYRLAEIIEMVTDTDLTSGIRGWYPPSEIFYELQKSEIQIGRPLLKHSGFIPSSQRLLFEEVEQLDQHQQAEFKELVSAKDLKTQLQGKDDLAVLDTLISYYNYKNADTQDDISAASEALKNRRLLALKHRLSLPVSNPRTPFISNPPLSPASGEQFGRFLLGGRFRNDENHGLLIGWSPYQHDGIGFNGLDGSALEVMNGSILASNEDRVRINELHVIRATKHATLPVSIPGESLLSWEIGFGWRRPVGTCNTCSSAYASFAFGRMFQPAGPSILTGPMLELAYEDRNSEWLMIPKLRLLAKGNRSFGIKLDTGWRHSAQTHLDNYGFVELQARIQLTDGINLRLGVEKALIDQSEGTVNALIEWRH